MGTAETTKYAKRRLLIAARRLQASKFFVRGLTVDEVTAALAASNVKQEDGTPWSRTTIGKDRLALLKQWGEETRANMAELKGRRLAEIAEVKRQAWLSQNYDLVLKCIAKEVDMLGLAEPIRIDVGAKLRDLARELGLDPELAIAEAERIVRAVDGS